MTTAMSAPSRYVMITPGPASAMVTLLPRKRPTPIAPPIAIIESWRELSRRWRSDSGAGLNSATAVATDCLMSAMFDSSARDALQHVGETVDFLISVVVDQRCPDSSSIGGNTHAAKQARGVHISVANADAVIGTLRSHSGRRFTFYVETNCWDTMPELVISLDSVDFESGNFRQFSK